MKQPNGTAGGRWQWGSYGFLAGLAVGVMAGWLFSGFVSAFIRVGVVALIVVPVAIVFLAWRRYVAPVFQAPAPPPPVASPNAIETRAVVHGQARDPLPR